jgi:hypothetical protein
MNRARSGYDGHIVPRPRALRPADGRTQNALRPVADDRSAELLASDKDNAALRAALFRRSCRKHYEQGVGRTLTLGEHTFDFAR